MVRALRLARGRPASSTCRPRPRRWTPTTASTLIFVTVDRADHDHDRPAGQRRLPAGLGDRPAGDAVPGAGARPGHRHRSDQLLLIAVGYLGILVAEGLNTTARWTRGLSRDSAEGFGAATPVVWRAPAYLAVPALVAAIVLGVALPTLSLPAASASATGRWRRSAAADRPDPGSAAQPQPARRPRRDPVPDHRPGRGLPADGLAAPVQRDRLEQRADAAEQRAARYQPSRA